MARNTITYARKRNRNKRTSILRAQSSPIQPITNPEEECYPEVSCRTLKRHRHAWKATTSEINPLEENASQAFKKPKLAHESPLPIAETSLSLQTPHPTSNTEEQVFKIESSRGEALPIGYDFSPVPPTSLLGFAKQESITSGAIRTKHKTSSSNLKENAIPTFSRHISSKSRNGVSEAMIDPVAHRSSKSKSKLSTRGASLASPFTSKPSSPQRTPAEPLPSSSELLPARPRRTLSDTHYNPNLPPRRALPQPQSTSSSPARNAEAELTKIRRPSAPSTIAQRPDIMSWFPSYTSTTTFRDHILSSSENFLMDPGTRKRTVDFNRPPSQLSCNIKYDEAFFGDALEVSTPFGPRARRSPTFADSPDSLDDDGHSDDRMRRLFGIKITRSLSLQTDVLGSWLSDSLISPPTLPRDGAYTYALPCEGYIDMTSLPKPCISGESSLGLGENMILPPSNNLLDDFSAREERSDDADGKDFPEPLQGLFKKLELGLNDGLPRPPLLRTRSLDHQSDLVPVGQSLKSPAKISPFKTKVASNDAIIVKRSGRDRRGTIRASDFAVSGSSALGGPRRTRSGTVVQGPTRTHRERSDTIVARSSNLTESTPVPSLGASDVDMHDVTDDTNHQELGDAIMGIDENDDELLLKGPWVDEDWVVAAPPSPVLPRRKNKGIPEWWKRFELKNRSGAMGIGHSDGDGEDDPLLLL
ncbi:hypothetical protein H0H87_001540 [Tephrocybe sp. NHM501043]|nr:hypothetical protein H0H87_001540 [Tephrocybe sp. NHM501043]